MIRPEKLKLNKEFRRAYGRGKSYVSEVLVSYVVKNRLGKIRIGITTSKKIGCAVERNRSRRVISAAFRQMEIDMNQSYDIVFVARSRTASSKSDAVLAAMSKQLLKAGIIKEKDHEKISD